MLFKIAFRNVRRQIGGYFIYFITVALTVSLLFSLAGLMFSDTVFNFSAGFKAETVAVCAFLSVVLAIVSALVLGYGCAFLLRRRKKEFGMYLTLGMTRGNIIAIFVGEMFFTFLFSLAAGLGLGMLVYQAIVAGISSFLEIELSWADYSSGAFVFTAVLVGIVFLITALASFGYLRFKKITELLRGESSAGRSAKDPRPWLFVTVVSFVVLVLSVVIVTVVASGRPGGGEYVFTLVGGSAVVFLSIVFTYVGALRCGTYYLLKNKKFSGKGTRTFTLRQLSGRIGGDSVLFGVIAVLLSVVVIGGNIFMTVFGAQVADIKLDYPYTLSVVTPYDKTGELTSGLPDTMEDFGEVGQSRLYSVFGLEEPLFEQYLMGPVWLLRESDYQALAEMAGEEAASLDGGAVLVCNRATYDEIEEKERDAEELVGALRWETDAFTLVFKGVSHTRSRLVASAGNYLLAVPDDVVDAVELSGLYFSAITVCAVNYRGDTFDETAMDDFFRAMNNDEKYLNIPAGHEHNVFFYVDEGSFYYTLLIMAAPWLMILLFVTIAFALLSMAVIALKSLAAVAEDRRRYRLLYLAGASRRQTLASLAVQTAIYFFLPFAVPLLLNVPVSFVCVALGGMMSGALTALQVVGYAALFSGLLLAFYGLYCAVTFLVARRDVGRALRASAGGV